MPFHQSVDGNHHNAEQAGQRAGQGPRAAGFLHRCPRCSPRRGGPSARTDWRSANRSAAAEADLRITAHQLTQSLETNPDFGLLFSCIGRGPYYDGIDHDLNVITAQFPDMPLIGFYGNGEIAPVGNTNQLLPYSAVLSLYAELNEV